MTLQRSSIPKILYDDCADVLYLKYASNAHATAKEIGGNIIAYFDNQTGAPTAITVVDFKWLEEKDRSWRSMLPIFIDVDRDIIPFI